MIDIHAWCWRHSIPGPIEWGNAPIFRVRPGFAPGAIIMTLLHGSMKVERAVSLEGLAISYNWRVTLASEIRRMRRDMASARHTARMPGIGEHRADAWRYGLELNRRYDALRAPKAADAGMRDTIAKLFPLPDYREPPRLVPTVSFGDPAPYAPGQAGPDVMMLGGVNRGSGKVSAILDSLSADLTGDEFAYRSPITGYIRKISLAEARDCDSRIYKKLIEMGWTPPPGTANKTKGD